MPNFVGVEVNGRPSKCIRDETVRVYGTMVSVEVIARCKMSMSTDGRDVER